MGCNTSKESVQPAVDEAKEDAKNGDIRKAGPDSPTEGGDLERSSDRRRAKDDDDSEKQKVEAATRIQAAFRGHHARKSMRETETSSKNTGTKSDSEPTKEQFEAEFRADDKELCNAATKIQASFRGHMSRKEQAAAAIGQLAENFVENAASKIEKTVEDAVNELEGIDLTDPDLHKAATKIQASFRGHKVRQEVSVTPQLGETEDKK